MAAMRKLLQKPIYELSQKIMTITIINKYELKVRKKKYTFYV